MRALRTIRGVDVQGKRVLVRIDCNVAVDEEGHPISGGEQRLVAVRPTIAYLRAGGARSVLLSHLGRPGGRVVEALRLDDVAKRLSVLLEVPVGYVPAVRGPRVEAAVREMEDGDVLLLENLRFDPGEEAGDVAFARELASLGELFVQEAFGVAHRPHASVAMLPHFLPSYAGLLFAREVHTLQRVLEHPARPATAVVSGAKMETKLPLLRNLLTRVDQLLPGGGIANTFLQVAGYPIGASLADRHPPADVSVLLEKYKQKIFLPLDVRVARAGKTSEALVVPARSVQPEDEILDLGPETAALFCAVLREARTCVWNGPLGKFELPAFAEGTRAVAQCVSAETFAVAGGGDTVRALTEMELLDRFDHVSTGGGAMLAFLEGTPLPGLQALTTVWASQRRAQEARPPSLLRSLWRARP